MASRTEKLRRRQHRKEKKRQRARKLGSEFAPPGGLVLVNPAGAFKMSEALIALVEPEWDTCADEEDMRKLLTLGMIAWNAALVEVAERTIFLHEIAQELPAELRPDFHHVVEPLIRRKEQLFPHVRRPMLSFDLTWEPPGDPYINVMSGLV
jgi:hypothetical protein